MSNRVPVGESTGSLRRYEFVQLDVFSRRPLEGNPLAVFTDARGLSDPEMQALAREMMLSETTFIFPRDIATERNAGVKVRIFTVDEELPFAGHPTLGTAFTLHGTDRRARSEDHMIRTRGHENVIHLDLKVGKVPVSFEEGRDGLMFGEMCQRDPSFGPVHSPEEVARATGLSIDDLDPSAPIQTVSTGLEFTLVPLRSLQRLQNLRVAWHQMADYLQRSQGHFFYFVCRGGVDPAARLHARMIFYNGEDPATGSAAGCAAAWGVRYGVLPPGQRALLEQGMEIKRPSQLFVRAAREGDRVSNVRVGGHAVEVLRGEVVL
ncbi:MAG TPA: PhzF family phenazine biosynthesis protein [Terriglobales bacterium]|nr:PhzF family phenazine biosynthesis protein [Terriglobales bacterium]